MYHNGKIWVGTGEAGQPVCLLPQMANRHGLIAGATGTGKTVTLKVMAEGFSAMGVPVFLGDIKGDLSGMAEHSSSLIFGMLFISNISIPITIPAPCVCISATMR